MEKYKAGLDYFFKKPQAIKSIIQKWKGNSTTADLKRQGSPAS